MTDLICGLDEVSKMPVVGSIFWAGVVIRRQDKTTLRRIGVKDSKKLSREKRMEIFPKLWRVAEYIDFIEITPAEIDKQELNLNETSMSSVGRLLSNIMEKTSPQTVYIDNFENSTLKFFKRFNRFVQPVKTQEGANMGLINHGQTVLIPEHHADERYPSVAAASIVAKCLSDWQRETHHLLFGNFGSGNPGDHRAERWVMENPQSPLIRKSWATYERLLDQNGKLL